MEDLGVDELVIIKGSQKEIGVHGPDLYWSG
jgi:hypothetical protein